MDDLFDDTNTQPASSQRTLGRSERNADGFAEFWAAYPSASNRRVGKRQALKKWIANGWAAQAKHIIAHIHHMKTEDCWLRGFHPLVLTYLNQERWLDWELPEQKPQAPDALATIKAHKGAAPSPETRQKIAALLGKKG